MIQTSRDCRDRSNQRVTRHIFNRAGNSAPNDQISKTLLSFICLEHFDLSIRICFEIRLPARSRFGEGRDFVLRI